MGRQFDSGRRHFLNKTTMKKPIGLSVLIAVLLSVSMASEAKGRSGYGMQGQSKKPQLNGVAKEGVTVEMRVLSQQEIKNVFGVDLLEEHIQPVVVKIKNDSKQTYAFHRANLNLEALSAAEAAKAAFENPIVVGGGLVKRGLGVIGRVIFPVKKAPEEKPITNSELQATFVREEMPEGGIAPDAFVQGFVFVRPLTPEKQLSLTLIKSANQQTLVFDAPVR